MMSILKIPLTLDDHILGNENASITLVEYGDYECRHCKAARLTVKQTLKHFDKQLRFAFRNFPLAQMHPHAEMAAETAEFAASYERFWEMHDLIYENQDHLSTSLLLKLAETLELPVKGLELAIAQKVYEPKIQGDFKGGVRSGVNGTPTFFINDHRYNGPLILEDLIAAIDSVLVK
jgi:protein-disulfide isomerase